MASLSIGLTGGLGSGKTTVSDFFQHKSIAVIDADEIVRELCLQPQIKKKLSAVFGRSQNNLRMRKQRDIRRQVILRSVRRRRALEKILHPLVWRIIAQRILLCQTTYCIVAVPLLLECEKNTLFDRILVVDAPQIERIKRVQRRSRWPLNEVLAMMSLQVKRGARLAAADDIIHNIGDIRQLQTQVSQLDAQYRAIAKQRNI